MITQKKSDSQTINWKEIARELAEKGDLPGTAQILKLIGHIKPEDKISAQDLASFILKDYGLTKRVIRLANSCFYNPQGIEIITVSRAVIFLGFETIKKIALATNFLEEILAQTPKNRRQIVLSLLSHSFFGAFLGDRLSPFLGISREEIFIHLLFHRLVRVLLAIHFPREYASLEVLEKEKPLQTREKLYRLGEALGRKWSFPGTLVEIFEGSPKSGEKEHPAYWVANIQEAAEAILKDKNQAPLKNLLKELKLKESKAQSLIEFAFRATKELYRPFEKYLALKTSESESPQEPASHQREDFFQKALAEITTLLASPESRYQDVIFMVLETICRSFECRGVLLGLFEPSQRALKIRVAVGSLNGSFKNLTLPLGDITSEIFQKGVEWAGKKISIPELEKFPLPSETDVLFSPLIVFGKPLGMIIAFREKPFSTEETQKINILRNLAVMSITQAQSQKTSRRPLQNG